MIQIKFAKVVHQKDLEIKMRPRTNLRKTFAFFSNYTNILFQSPFKLISFYDRTKIMNIRVKSFSKMEEKEKDIYKSIKNKKNVQKK